MKRMNNCRICGYQAVYLGGGFSFSPMICCDARTTHTRRIAHRKKSIDTHASVSKA